MKRPIPHLILICALIFPAKCYAIGAAGGWFSMQASIMAQRMRQEDDDRRRREEYRQEQNATEDSNNHGVINNSERERNEP